MARPPAYRLKDGTVVPGTTTIIGRYRESGALLFWAWKQGKEGKDFRETKDKAAESGTLAHAAVEAKVRGLPFEWPEKSDADVVRRAKKALENFEEWASQTKLQITHSEVPLISERYKYGGTLDCMLISGKRSLGDYKTSNGVYPDYLIQLGAYGILWEENFPDMPIEGGYHLLRFAKEFADFSHHFWSELETAKKAFILMRQLWDLDPELKARAK